jgi:hypothetical protein
MSNENNVFTTTPPAEDVTEWLAEAVGMKGASMVELYRAFGDRPTDERITVWEGLASNDSGQIAKISASMVRSAERSGRAVTQGDRVAYLFIARKADRQGVDQLSITVPSGGTPRASGQRHVEVHDWASAMSHALTENTKLLGLVVKAFDGRDESVLRQLALMTERCGFLERQHSETMAAQQKFVLFQMEQTQLSAKIARDEKRDQMIFGKLTAWGPMIINRLLGGGPGKGSPAIELLLGRLVEGLSDNQVNAIMDLPLSSEQKQVLGEILMSHMRRAAETETSDAAAVETPLNHAASNGAAP